MGEGECSWLDEFLCEYVDGTMDGAVKKSFEECLGTDPLLAEQVEHLRRMRTLLCHCRMHAPNGLQARVQRRLAGEMMRTQPPAFHEAATHLSGAAMFASAMVIALMVGMLVGATILVEHQPSVADHTMPAPNLPSIGWMSTPSASMTPLSGQRPHPIPLFIQPSAPVLTPLAPASPIYQFPEFMRAIRPYPAVLQRTDVAP